MDKQKIKAFYERNVKLHDTCQNELPGVMEEYWEELSNFIASDIPGAIAFICEDPDCDEEIFADWSEVFDDVARKTQSREFVEALKVAARRFPAACDKYSIAYCIECAEDELLD